MRLSPIHHTFAPHVDGPYLRRAIGLDVTGHMQHGKSGEQLKDALTKTFNRSAFFFSTGRESLLALLRAMDLKAGEEIILQGYTCVVLPNAIHTAGGVPIYADIDPDTLNLTVESVEPLITSRTRAVICQHTFGIPADTKALRTLCDEKNILLIEDCAHILPDSSGPDIGKYGDVLLLSFGRDKAISGISGGAVSVRSEGLSKAMEYEAAKAIDLPRLKLVQWMNYVQFYALARPLMGIGIGKAILKVARALHLLTPIVDTAEKNGTMSPAVFKLPNMCANLALFEFEKLKQINDHRRMLTKFYLEECKKLNIPVLAGVKADMPLQKFPLFVQNASGIRTELKKQNIHLDDGWTGCVVCPASTEMESMNYTEGSDPEAEKASQMIFSLPTHPTMTISQAEALMRALKTQLKPLP